MSQNPAAFLSYVRFDDQYEHGLITEFCQRLSGAVQVQTGADFSIFQDHNDIAWGQQWQERINESLDAVTFLIPILTPSFFKREACRGELERFLDREKQLGRNDLILPVYYVDCPVLNEAAKRDADPLAKVIASRQRIDWRELRFEPLTSPEVRKMIAKMAKQVVDALDRAPTQRSVAPAPQETGSRKSSDLPEVMGVQEKSDSAQPSEATPRVTQKTEPPTIVVDALYRGDYTTLNDAIKAAKAGDRILVRPGLYTEGIVIDKPIEIIGEGDLGEVVIEAKGRHVVLFQAHMGRIANLTLRQTGGEEGYAVEIAEGRLHLEGCDITSQNGPCVGIHGGADPRLHRNRIHDGVTGIMVYDNGQGTIEDNEIFGNTTVGLVTNTGGNPTVRRNRIHDGVTGIVASGNGQGTIEDNEIFGNTAAGLVTNTGGNPTVRRNRIHDGATGIVATDNGQGTIEDNEIFGNTTVGVWITSGSNPTLRRNRISKNHAHAICVSDGSAGLFEDNDLRGNRAGAWDIARDCLDKVKRTRNKG